MLPSPKFVHSPNSIDSSRIIQSPKSFTSRIKSPLTRGISIETLLSHNGSEIIDAIQQNEVNNFRLGLFFLFIAITTWIIGLEVVSSVLKGDTYQKPVLCAYLAGSCFTFNLIPEFFQGIKTVFTVGLRGFNFTPGNEENVIDDESDDENDDESQKVDHLEAPIPLTTREIIKLSFQISIIYFVYNIFGLSALKYTSVSNLTVLSSTTSIFTLVVGRLLHIDSFSIKKVFCIVSSFTGILLINISDAKIGANEGGDNKYIPKNPLFGNILAICAASMYAFYLIIMKVSCGTGERATDERKLFGYVGLFSLILGIPIIYISNITGFEPFEFPPPNNTILIMVLTNAFFTYISDYFTILALLLTTPLITSLTLTSAVPITIFIDYLILKFSGDSSSGTSTTYFIGIISILVSVVLININASTENELIESTIDDTLNRAISHDEALSPVLSPMLTSKPYSRLSSPFLPFSSNNKDRVPKNITSFNLEGENLINNNHSSNLYTVSNSNNDDNNENSNHKKPTIVVYGGEGHSYRIKHLDDQDS